MSKIKLNNSYSNRLFNFLKETQIKYSISKKHNDSSLQEVVFLYPKNNEQRENLISMLENYRSSLYHNSTLQVDMSVFSIFNYSSNQYENITSDAGELELPLFYVENENEQNKNLH